MCRCTVMIIGYCVLCYGADGSKYPNEIIDTPIVSCEQDNIVIKIRTSSANPSQIYAEDFHETAKCMVRNQNRIAFPHNDCGMTKERLDNPAGTMYRICLSVQIHPLFVTDSDRSYCAQCVYMDANLVDDLERNIDISEMTHNELDPQFDEASNPQCSYSIRKGTVDGPEVHAAVVGDTVFHVWQCNNENVGILVQNCHVEDLQGDKILIIDQNGCGVDQYLFRTPQYSNDLHTAFLQSSVFKFVDKSMTRFRCQLRLCVKNRGKGCETITPPSGCPTIDESATDASPSSSAPSVAVHSSVEQQPLRSLPQPSQSLVGVSPPSGRIEPPSGVVAHGGNVVSGGTESGSTSPATLKPGKVEPPAGPPSIRPYGPGTSGQLSPGAQIVSGKTSEQAENIATLPASSYPYLHRERRSATLMLYGNGSSRGLAAPPLAPRAKRQMGPESAIGEGTASTPLKNDGAVQELDVVGLIRVLDNPDDIQYFADQQSRAGGQQQPLNGSGILPTAPAVVSRGDSARAHRLHTVLRQQRIVQVPSPAAAVPQLLQSVSIEERHLPPMPRTAETLNSEKSFAPEGSTCVSTGTFRGLVFTLGTLLGIQLCAVALVLVDRFLLDGKCVNKRLHKVLASNRY
uniref:ZP domain-containing protein n=1 Tax=Globodera pallida TaxID=36090 RepID=A0A183BWB5_GLOPA